MSAKNSNNGAWRTFLSSDRKVIDNAKKIEESVSKHADQFLIKKMHLVKEVRRMILTWLSLILIILILVSIGSFYGQKKFVKAAPDYQKYFEGLVGEIETLNPIFARHQAERSVEQLIFSSLYKYDQKGNLKSDLIKNLTIDQTKKNYLITLRDDIKWQDGKALTAEDVKYTVDLFKDQGINTFTGQALRGVATEILSRNVIEFRLRSPYISFPHLLTFPILPKHVLSDNKAGKLRESDFNYFPIGSGPFMVADFVLKNDQIKKQNDIRPEVKISLVKNPYYPNSKLQELEILIYQNDQKLSQALERGEVNSALFNNVLLTDANLSNFEVKNYQVASGVFAFFNLKSNLFSKIEHRQAFQSIIDVDKIRQEYQNRYQTAVDFDYPIMIDYFDKSIKLPAQKTDKQIKTIFAKSKIVNKKQKWYSSDKPLTVKMVSIKDSNYQLAAELLAQNIRNYGIDVQLELLDLKTDKEVFNKRVFEKKDYDILVYELELGANPDVYSFWHSSQIGKYGLNFSNYKSDLVDQLLLTARSTADPKLRKVKYRKFVELWLNDLPAIGLYQKTHQYLTDNKVKTTKNSSLIRINDRYHKVINWSNNTTEIFQTP